jgi:hypothetical protein
MKMLEAGGLEIVTDGERTADEDNPKGYYELERVKDLAKDPDKSWLGPARGKAIKVISTLLKELPKDHNYKVVFMRRNIDEVLASQAKMLERRGEENTAEDAQMRELFENDLWRAGYLLEHAAHFEHLDVPYAEAVADPRAQAQRIAEFLGGDLDVDAMTGVVDAQLYRNRAQSAQ